MTCFDGELFPPEEAAAFTERLFDDPPPAAFELTASFKPMAAFNQTLDRLPRNYRLRPCAAPRTKLPFADIAEIKAHIIGLYRSFLAEGNSTLSRNWTDPLLNFMKQLPRK
jgi:hypothetical protein